MELSTKLKNAICDAANCRVITSITPMQSLWAGQGELARLTLSAENGLRSLVVKQITFNESGDHPRGWNTSFSQARKRQSYQVELNWYQHFSKLANQAVHVSGLVYSESSEQGMLLVLEDLVIDYPVRFTAGKEDRPSTKQIKSSLTWLANFHARFLNVVPKGLWPVGGYWHLKTRPDEWQAMASGKLKYSADDLDKQLNSCCYQALIHGDAKLANFCFTKSGDKVAAVDFQYVGQGPGVKDLMLLLSSVMPDERLLSEAQGFVDYYFQQLATALNFWQPDIDAKDVLAKWGGLYSVAWADFHRFLAGWSPGHWKIGNYCSQQTKLAVDSL